MSMSQGAIGTQNLIVEPFDDLNPALDLISGEDKVPKNRWVTLHNVTSSLDRGNMVSRRGYAQCNATAFGATVDGIYRYYKTITTTETLYVTGGKLYKVTTNFNSPTEITQVGGASIGLTAGAHVQFVTIAKPDRGVILNSLKSDGSGDGIYYYNGTNVAKVNVPKVGTTGNVTAFLYAMFHPVGRLVLFGATDTGQAGYIFWSAVDDPTNFTVSLTGGGFSKLYHDETGLRVTCGGYIDEDILGWNESSCYRISQWNLYDSTGTPLVPVVREEIRFGCVAPYSLQRWGLYWIWLSAQGVYKYAGGVPEHISGDIYPDKKTQFAASYAALAAIFAVIYNDEYMLFYNNTAESKAYNNRALVCDLWNNTWCEFRNMTFKCGCMTGGHDLMNQLYFGSAVSTKGFIWRWGEREDTLATVYRDNVKLADGTGDAITAQAIGGWFDFQLPFLLKRASHIEIEYDFEGAGTITDGKIYFYFDDHDTYDDDGALTNLHYITIPTTEKVQRLYFPKSNGGVNLNLFFRKMKIGFYAVCNGKAIIFKRFRVYALPVGAFPAKT